MEKLFQSVEESPDPRPVVVTGKFPKWLEGRLYRIGPAKWDLKDFSLNHWLDGCALIYKFTMKDGKVEVMSKFLKSEAYQKMMTVGRPVFTEFGTKSFPDPCKNVFSRFFSQIVPLELTDNDLANVFPLEDEIYCVSETSNLWKVDKDTLESVEKVDLKQLLSVNLASSHPHRSSDGTFYNLGTSFMSGLRYHIMKVPPQSDKLDEADKKGFDRCSILCNIPCSWKASFSYYHSFGLSPRYVVFVEQPLLVNTIKLAASGLKGHSLRECMEWSPKEKTRFHVIDRVSGQEVKNRYITDPLFFFHHVNTYEEDDQLVVDLVGFDGPEVLDKFYLKTLRLGEYDATCPPQMRRFVLPLSTDGPKGGNLVKVPKCRANATKQNNGDIVLQPQFVGNEGFELPTINYEMCNTRKYRYVYGTGVFETGRYKNALVKLDITTDETIVWREKDTMYPSEANFIQRPDATEEDDGVLLSVVIDVDTDSPDFLLVLDAKTFKEIARATIPQSVHLPPTLHGYFLADQNKS